MTKLSLTKFPSSTVQTAKRYFTQLCRLLLLTGGLSILFVTSAGAVEVIPRPRELVWKEGSPFRFSEGVGIVSVPETMIAAEDLQKELKEVAGITSAIIQPQDVKKGAPAIVLQVGGLEEKDSKNLEAYTLVVDAKGILIRSQGAAGIFYGVQTLKQILQRQGDDIVALGCEVRDEPAHAWRGEYLHLTYFDANPESVDYLKNVIEAFAQLKLNVLFMELGSNIQYDRQPFPKKEKTAFSKAQVRELVEFAKARHFEVIPSFQMLTHVPWILANPKNVDLLEDPTNTKWGATWCPSNPAVEKFAKDILEETAEVFQPRYCSVGLDEVNQGPFGVCEKCRKVEDKSQLFLKSIMLQYDILAGLGVKTIMWQDSLLPPDGAYTRPTDPAKGWTIVDQVPKDITIADWDYSRFDEASKARLKYFTDKGFPVLGVTADVPVGIQTFSEGLKQDPKTLGMFNTHWYRVQAWSDPQTINPRAWVGITLHAQYAWNPENPPLEEIQYDPVNIIREMIGPKESLAKIQMWEPVELAKIFNARISDEKESWPGRGPDNSLSTVFDQNITSGDVRFEIGKEKTGNNVVILSGKEDDGLAGDPVSIPIQKKTKKLAFLHSCNIPLNAPTLNRSANVCQTPSIGKYRMNYDDGTFVDVDLLYRWNIVDWNNKYGVFGGRIAFVGETKVGSRIELIRTDWINPHPEKIIESITASTEKYEGASLALFAVSTESPQTGASK